MKNNEKANNFDQALAVLLSTAFLLLASLKIFGFVDYPWLVITAIIWVPMSILMVALAMITGGLALSRLARLMVRAIGRAILRHKRRRVRMTNFDKIKTLNHAQMAEFMLEVATLGSRASYEAMLDFLYTEEGGVKDGEDEAATVGAESPK